MSDSKIQIKIGIVEFSGEGNQDWLASQLDKILLKVPELLKIELASPGNVNGNSKNDGATSTGTKSSQTGKTNLATFLREKNPTSAQVQKFLATAAFLQNNGKGRLNTGDIAKALKEANQTKLNNPSDCLNQNVKKGHCEKDGKSQFFVTSQGFTELGIEG